jgi:hypothetical protein
MPFNLMGFFSTITAGEECSFIISLTDFKGLVLTLLKVIYLYKNMKKLMNLPRRKCTYLLSTLFHRALQREKRECVPQEICDKEGLETFLVIMTHDWESIVICG